MENVISRFRNTANLIVLAAVLVLQVIGLAVQVKRPTESGSTSLIRLWTISIISPITRGVVHTQNWISDTWHDYVWLRGLRKQNEELKNQIVQMKLREVRLVEDANQARRLQLLLGFKEKYIAQTLPAQVISTTGSEFSRAIYIDKGSNDGIKQDMPVITPEGIVGKILRVMPSSSLILLINDPTSGAGVILEKSRLQGILKGTASGTTVMHNVMVDESVQVGDRVETSGGDRIFPKGMPVGTVTSVSQGQDLFLDIRVRPAAPIGRLEEVLVITKVDERAPDPVATNGRVRAIDILAERLPTVQPPKSENEQASPAGASGKPATATATTEKKNAAPPDSQRQQTNVTADSNPNNANRVSDTAGRVLSPNVREPKPVAPVNAPTVSTNPNTQSATPAKPQGTDKETPRL